MKTRAANTAVTLLRHTVLLLALAVAGASGCGLEEEADQTEAAETDEQALARGGGSRGLSYSCTNGTCTCDKSIENDCANMTADCTDATVDAVINCINGWLTTHCTCTQARTAPSPTTWGTTLPLSSVKTLKAR